MLGVDLGCILAQFELKIVIFKASNPRNLGTKSFEEEDEEGRREGTFTSKFVYSLPLSLCFSSF